MTEVFRGRQNYFRPHMGDIWSDTYMRTSLSLTVPDYVRMMLPDVGAKSPDLRNMCGACPPKRELYPAMRPTRKCSIIDVDPRIRSA